MKKWDSKLEDDISKQLNKSIKEASIIYEKWDEIGFLETLPESIQGNVALSLEKMSNILTLDEESEKPKYSDFIKTLTFVSLVSICRKLREYKINEDEVEDFINELDFFMKNIPLSTIKEITLSSHQQIDVEAELLSRFIEHKVDEYNNEIR